MIFQRAVKISNTLFAGLVKIQKINNYFLLATK